MVGSVPPSHQTNLRAPCELGSSGSQGASSWLSCPAAGRHVTRSSLVDMDLQVLAKEIGHVRLALHSGPGSYAKTAGYGGHCMRVQVHRRKAADGCPPHRRQRRAPRCTTSRLSIGRSCRSPIAPMSGSEACRCPGIRREPACTRPRRRARREQEVAPPRSGLAERRAARRRDGRRSHRPALHRR